MVKKKKSAFESLEAEIIKGAGDYIGNKVKRKAIRIGEISALIFMGFILISFGLAYYIAHNFLILDNGLSFMLLGIVFLIVSFVL